jgi:hypothetical protein
MLASWPWPLELELLEPALFNDARGFSRFDLRGFIFAAAIDRGERHARSASVGAR